MAPSEQGDLKTKKPKNQKTKVLRGSCQSEAGVFPETFFWFLGFLVLGTRALLEAHAYSLGLDGS